MPNVVYPYRVAFLPTKMVVPQGAEQLQPIAALLIFTTLFEHFLRHPRVAVYDPDDFTITDSDERLLTVDHPGFEDVQADCFGKARREEILWFELSLDPARPTPVKLGTMRFDGKREEFAAIGQGPLSQLMANCLQQWLAARNLPPAPRPLEMFEVNDIGYGAQCAYQTIASRQEDGSLNVQMPHRLLVPFLRLVNISCNLYTYEQILQIEPDNPWAIRDRFIDGLHRNGPESRDPIRAAIKAAPMYGKLYLSMFGKDVPAEESVHSFGIGTYINPQNPFAPKDYAYHLDQSGRWEEAWRWAERAVRNVPLFLDAHIVSMAVSDSCRFGERLVDCGHHMGFIENVTERGIVEPDDPGARNIRLQYANALKRAGRLQEAINVRARCLEGLTEKWPQQTKILQEWQSDPTELAEAYGREAHYRGDPGRVIEAFSAHKPESAADLAMLIDALVAVGKEDLALLCYGQHADRNWTMNPVARLAGAKAQILCGRAEDAIESMMYISLRFPQLRWETAVNRTLRMAAARPIKEWEAVVQRKLASGAGRVAKLIARDAADFVPGAEKSQVIVHALSGGGQPVAFNPSWLVPLAKALAPLDFSQVDAFFAHYAQPSLAYADAMAVDWASLVPARHDNDNEDAVRARAAKILFIYAGAVTRYLAATTQPPSVLAGGYRQVAADALEMLRGARGILPRLVIRAFFEVLERVAPLVDEWTFDTWLLRLERALDLEANEAGKLEPLVQGFARVGALLRGDERIAIEYRTGWLALKAEDFETAYALLERTVRAIGNHAAPYWSDSAKRLPPDRALDVHMTAAHANPGNARASVEACKCLLGARRGREAFEALLIGFGGAGQKWQQGKLAELAPLWQQGGAPVPIDFNQSQTAGMNALNQGNFDLAALCYRFCEALDSKNEVVHKNLGIAYARQGKVYEAVNAFCGASAKEGALMAAIAFKDAKLWKAAVYAYRLASLWFDDADKWRWLATAAHMAEDSDVTAEAYGKVAAANPALLDPAALNAHASACYEIGDYQTCAAIAKRMVDGANNDPTWASLGMHNMACALIGMKRQQDAMQWAEQALKVNPRPDNRQAFMETYERAKKGEPVPPKPRRAATPEGQAWKLVEDGDFKQLAALLGSAQSWKLKRAAITASMFRFESENDVEVTPRALEAARMLATTTYGSMDADALLARADALKIRENAFYAVDVPCPLGPRLAKNEFQRMFEQQSGRPGPQAAAAAQMAQQLVASGAAGDPDPTVFPGGPVPKLSDYVRIMKGMQSGNPMGAMKAAGLSMQQYSQVAMAWGQKMAQDPTLTAKFTKMMSG